MLLSSTGITKNFPPMLLSSICSVPPDCILSSEPTTHHSLSPSLTHLAYIQNHCPVTTVLSNGHHDTPMKVQPRRLNESSILATSLTYVTAPIDATTFEVLFVGSSDGSIRGYSASTLELLFSQRYHNHSPILHIRSQTTSVFSSSSTTTTTTTTTTAAANNNNNNNSKSTSHGGVKRGRSNTTTLSELWMLHEDGTIVVLHLGHAIRSMRAFTNNVTNVEEPCLHRKWTIQRCLTCTDFAAVSPSRTDLFETNLRPLGANVLIVGQDPFCSIYLADGDSSQSNPITLKSAAMELGSAVLSSVGGVASNFIPSWLTSSSSSKNISVDRDVTIPWQESKSSGIHLKRHRPLFDSQRHVRSTALSMRLCVSACVDNLGRVVLVDMNDGTVLRMLKGYRDAQVGWMTTQRHEYLVIYAPNRNRIKIWKATNGPLVGSIDVGLAFGSDEDDSLKKLQLLTMNGSCYLISTRSTTNRNINGSSDNSRSNSGSSMMNNRQDPNTSMVSTLHRIDINQKSVKATLKRHYVTATHQKDGVVLSEFSDGIR
jgi:hypothetical protein